MFFADCPLDIINYILSFITSVSHAVHFLRCNKQLYDRTVKARVLWKWWETTGKYKSDKQEILFTKIIPSVFNEVINKRCQLLIGAELVFHSTLAGLLTDKVQNKKSNLPVRLLYNACEYIFCDVLGWENNPYMDRVEWQINLLKFEITQFNAKCLEVRVMIQYDGCSDWKQVGLVQGNDFCYLMHNLLKYFDMYQPAKIDLVDRLCSKDINMNNIRFYRPLDDVCSDVFKDYLDNNNNDKSTSLLTTKIFPNISSFMFKENKQEIFDSLSKAMIPLGNFNPYCLFIHEYVIRFHMDRQSFPYANLEVLKELLVVRASALSSILLKDEYKKQFDSVINNTIKK